MMKKRPSHDEEPLSRAIVFCTTCGDKLDDFCFTSEAEHFEAVKKHNEECKKKGRFAGDLCARVFIAKPENLNESSSNE